ncbi:MAG: hypothetical protein ACLRXD_06640 [Coprococcus sp.]|jgi:hypothetical protein
MSRDVVVQAVLEYLQKKYDLSDLEKDIMSTLSKYNEQPFDRKGAEQKVVENNRKYPDISTAIKMVPGINVIPFSEVSDEGVRDNLKMQIEAMCFKEYNIIKS